MVNRMHYKRTRRITDIGRWNRIYSAATNPDSECDGFIYDPTPRHTSLREVECVQICHQNVSMYALDCISIGFDPSLDTVYDGDKDVHHHWYK